MARVTIEDCLLQVSSRFDLTMIAAKRARQLARGAEPRLPWGDHKSTVLALKEIAEALVTVEIMQEPDLPPLKAENPVALIDPYLGDF